MQQFPKTRRHLGRAAASFMVLAAAVVATAQAHVVAQADSDGSGNVASGAAQAPSAYQPFRFDPALRTQLSDVPTSVVQGKYQVRLPSTFTLRRSIAKGGATEDSFSMPQDPNGFLPTFAVICRHVDVGADTPMQFLRAREAHEIVGLRAQMHDPVTAGPQFGTINGIDFCRVYVKGVQSFPQKHVVIGTRGFFYEGEDQGTLVTIIALDTQQYGDTSVPLAEAAALTFSRR